MSNSKEKPKDGFLSFVSRSCLMLMIVPFLGASCFVAMKDRGGKSEVVRTEESLALTQSAESTPLAPHRIAEESELENGYRLEIHVDDPNLTKDQCIAILKAYEERIGENGQISVHKPSSHIDGDRLPWGVLSKHDGASGALYDDDGIKFYEVGKGATAPLDAAD